MIQVCCETMAGVANETADKVPGTVKKRSYSRHRLLSEIFVQRVKGYAELRRSSSKLPKTEMPVVGPTRTLPTLSRYS